jgi:membrane-associated phospholipid phosphatase
VRAKTEPLTRQTRSELSARLLPAAGRRIAWLIAACCAAIVATLPLTFGRRGHPDLLDRTVDQAVKAAYGSGHHQLLTWLAVPGTQIPVIALVAVIFCGCLLTRRPAGAALAIIAVPVAIVATDDVVKPLVNRTTLGFSSYPSGHASSTFAIAAVLAVVLFGPLGRTVPRVLRLIVTLAAVLVGCVVSTAVIALSWHYFTDTIAGAAIGVGSVAVIALLLDLAAPRRWLAATGRWIDEHRPGHS